MNICKQEKTRVKGEFFFIFLIFNLKFVEVDGSVCQDEG